MVVLEDALVEAIDDAMDSHTWVKRRVTSGEFLAALEAHGYTIVRVENITADAVIANPSPAPEPEVEWGGIEQFQAEDR